jgi:Flp pilus assembly protein TadG
MRKLRHRRGHAADDGAAAVEFALVVPFLLLVVFGIINFGFLFSQQLTLNNGVREGARRAVVNDPSAPRTCDGIIASIKNQLSGLGLNASSVQVKVTQDGFVNEYACGTTFQSTTFAPNANNVPCKGSLDTTNGQGARSLIVEVQYNSTIPVAFPPFPTTLTLSSKAVYRCEFTA